MLGHEGAGVVERVGSAVAGLAPGDRVGMTFDSCGALPDLPERPPVVLPPFFEHNFAAARADGTSVLSRDGELIHGHFFGQSSFATHALAGARNVVRLPDGIGLELAAPFGCGIQTGAGAVLNSLRVPAGSSIAIFGTGTVGLAAVLAAVDRRCDHDHRRRREPVAARARARAGRDACDRRAATGTPSSASADDHGGRRRLQRRDHGVACGLPQGASSAPRRPACAG